MKIAKRNHYNPCFWTALWNPNYYRLATTEGMESLSVREQSVYVLNVKSEKLFQTTVERVHYEKNLGLAEISREAAEDFSRRHYPQEHEEFVRKSASSPYPVFIDFEQILTAMEKLLPYQTLLKVAVEGRIESREDKAHLSSFLVWQLLRSHAIMNSMIDWHRKLGHEKFEHFVMLKRQLGNTSALANRIELLVCGQWSLFSATDEIFPLCDSPILVKSHSIMVALSPKLLLEIDLNIKTHAEHLPITQQVSPQKLEEYRCRTIGNTFREIIGDEPILKQWQTTPEFKARVDLMRNAKN